MEEKTYKTGDVQPPKNYRQVITLLLLLVLFLGCLVSALSFANIRLFRLLEQQDQPLLSFGQVQHDPAHSEIYPVLGISGCYLTELEQAYFSLPAGVYITEAGHALLQPGDVVVGINGTALTEEAVFSQMLKTLQPGTELTLQICRGEHTFSVADVFYEGDE